MRPDVPLGRLRAAARALLSSAGAPDSGFEADQIVSRVLGRPRAYLHAHPEEGVPSPQFSKVMELSGRRASGEPLAYVLGDALFCGRPFFVDGRVLIPRPETEVLTEWADSRIKALPGGGVFADWCTGSGCVAVTLLLENPGWRACAVDSSPGALGVARENARAAGVSERVEFLLCARPREAADAISPRSLDLIVANPPYIPTDTIPALEPQVRGYEPREALDGGPDGLDVCRLLLAELPRYMKPGAPLVLETGGEEQADRLAAAAAAADGCVRGESFADGFGIRRFVVWRRAA